MQQAFWNGKFFEISPSKVMALSSFETTVSVKKETDEQNGASKILGKNLQELKLSFYVSFETGTDPRAEFNEWEKLIGTYAPFVLEGVRFGAEFFQLRQVSMNDFSIDAKGRIRTATIECVLREYADGKSSSDMQIIYKGKNIFPDISVNSCVYDMHAEGQADILELVFNDTSRIWDSWKAENEEKIIVQMEGVTTGKMFIHDVKPENGTYTLKAQSVPPTFKNRRSKTWEGVKFSELAQEIAARHGLKFEGYDLPEETYSYVCQDNEEDFVFLNKRCKFEGCSFLVFDEKLCVYGEKNREAAPVVDTIYLSESADFAYTDNTQKSFKNIELVNAQFVGKYEAQTESGSRTLRKNIITPETSQSEADRFAKNILRLENKNQKTGIITRDLLRQIAAGSVIGLQNSGAASWNGSAFVYHVRNDFKTKKTKIWIRRPLEY